uniref:Uncharacterized protein n=1 Tax=Anguilla anguilla TaxID=7936 RepID=A0A0E9XS04_ANGAN
MRYYEKTSYQRVQLLKAHSSLQHYT